MGTFPNISRILGNWKAKFAGWRRLLSFAVAISRSDRRERGAARRLSEAPARQRAVHVDFDTRSLTVAAQIKDSKAWASKGW
jgi:hypothetical protein